VKTETVVQPFIANEMHLQWHLGGPLSHFEQRVGVDLDELKVEIPPLVMSVRNEMTGGAKLALLSVMRESTNSGRNAQCDAWREMDGYSEIQAHTVPRICPMIFPPSSLKETLPMIPGHIG
jgi:hypothetical protein